MHSAQHIICVLDGLPLSEHKAHTHSSFVEADTDGEGCAICDFSIAKILRPSYFMCEVVTACLGSLPAHDYLFSLYTFFDHCSGRAPPC